MITTSQYHPDDPVCTPGFAPALLARLQEIERQGLLRTLLPVETAQGPLIRVAGRELLNFSSNDYLGLANDPVLREAAIEATRQFGAGSGASRLICGSLVPHHRLEETLAEFKGTEGALAFSSGYATAVGAITALLDARDVIILDKLVHASVVDAARLSRAKLRVFRHNDLTQLEAMLRWADERPPGQGDPGTRGRTLIVTESVFSMDGDQAPLAGMVELKDRYGAWLMVDEAHATGLYGPRRRGLAEALGVGDRIEVQMGTLGKSLGASGGYICGCRPLIDLLINRARSFVFSTAPVPAAAAAATAGIREVMSERGAERCARLWERVQTFHEARQEGRAPVSAILPVLVGSEAAAMALSARLRALGFFVPAVRFPTVARGAARLRVTLTAAHTLPNVRALVSALADAAAT